MSSEEVIRRLKKEGWYLKSQVGSHTQWYNDTLKKKVTVPHPRKDLKPKTLLSIYKQAGCK